MAPCDMSQGLRSEKMVCDNSVLIICNKARFPMASQYACKQARIKITSFNLKLFADNTVEGVF